MTPWYPGDLSFSWLSDQRVKHLPAYSAGDLGSVPGSGRSPGEGNGNALQYFCLENPMDRGALVGYSWWGRKESDMTEFTSLSEVLTCTVFPDEALVAQRVKNLPAVRETRVPSLGQAEPLEEEMAAHSTILAWRIPRTEEPGSLWSMGSQSVRHNWATSLSYSMSILKIFLLTVLFSLLQNMC